MAFLQLQKCLSDPKHSIKLIVLVICVCVTIYQLTECVRKIMHPPVSTYYKFHLNETIKYPSITICRRPGYKTELFPTYGLITQDISTTGAFKNFPFNNTTIGDFLQKTTFTQKDTIPLYSYKGEGFNSKIELTSLYFLDRGRCYVVNPNSNSDIFGVSGGYYFYLKHTAKEKIRDSYGVSKSGFEIYFHDSNEILLYKEDSVKFLYLESSEDMQVTLNLQKFTQISTLHNPCIEDINYSKSKCQENCYHNQLAEEIGCTLPWLRNLDKNYPNCSTSKTVEALIKALNHEPKKKELMKNCNCKDSCITFAYNYNIQSRRENGRLVGSSSTINIYFASNLITTLTEVIGYDWNVFLADVGGSLGFLLGLSVIGVITVIEQIVLLVLRRKTKGTNETQKENLDTQNLDNIVEFINNCEMYEKELAQKGRLYKINCSRFRNPPWDPYYTITAN